MLHEEIEEGFIHRVCNWTYADAAARAAATVFVAGDVGKFARQLSPYRIYELIDHSPVTWGLVGGGDAADLMTFLNTRVGKTGAYTVLAGDRGKVFDATANTWTLALTAAATLGNGFAFAIYNSGSGVITIDPDAAETIRDSAGSATTKTLAQGEGGIVICDGTGFFFIKTSVAAAAPTLASLGAVFNSRVGKTGAYTALLADKGKLIDATANTWTLTLTAAATLGDGWELGIFNSGSGVITIDADAAETIRDKAGSAATKTLAQGESGILICDGVGFLFIKASVDSTGTTASAGDNSTTVATTAYADRAAATSQQNAQTGTGYTLVLADQFKTVTIANASANTVTVPPNSSVAFPVGTRILGWTLGAGQTTLTPGAGVTINSRGAALKSAGQYASWMIEKIATDTWLATGDLTT